MTLLVDLQNLTIGTQTKQIDANDSYMEHAGPVDFRSFMESKARKGETSAMFHLEKEGNARIRKAGYQSLSGQIGTLRPEPGRGLISRNGVGWLYMNLSTLNETQFKAEVQDFIDYLESEGIVITSEIVGTSMADIGVSWA